MTKDSEKARIQNNSFINKKNTKYYMPSLPYHPVTKRFVDEYFFLGETDPLFNNLTVKNQTQTGTLKVGDVDGGNYIEFLGNGTMVAHGTATSWEDIEQSLIGGRLESPSSDIVLNLPEGSVTFENSATLSDFMVVNIQMSHRKKLGSVIRPHIHWWQISANIPNWLIQTRWQIQGAAKTTSWTSVKWDASAFTYVSGTFNQITTFSSITPPVGYGLSDINQIRVLRDNNNASGLFAGADPESSDVDAVNFDAHIEMDTLGSELEYTK